VSRSLLSVIVGTFTLRFSTGLTGFLLVNYLADLEQHGGQVVMPLEVALIAIAFYLSELVLSPVFGVLCDRIGIRPVMLLGPAFGAIAAVITGLTTSIPILLGTRLLEGSSTAASVPAILGFLAIATSTDEGLRGRTMARFELATLGGLAGGSVAGGFLWEVLGPASFFLNAGLYGVSWAIYRYLVDYHDPVRATERAAGQPLGATIRDRFGDAAARYGRLLGSSHVLLLAPTWIALNAAISTIGSFQIVFQLRGGQSAFADEQLLMRGFSAAEISTGLLVGMVVFVAGVLFWGNQFKRYRRTTIIAFGAFAGLVGLVAAFLANHAFGASPIVFVALAVAGLGAVFVLAGGTPAALGLLADISESYEHDRGAIMGLYSVFLAIGQILGQSLAGVAAEIRGIDGLLGLTFVLVLVALAPLYSLRLYEHRIGGEEPGVVPRPHPSSSADL
jgi:MFS family permease